MDGEIFATGLDFPEGPVWTGDALVVTEVEAGRLTRLDGSGTSLVAMTGGGPNGAAEAEDGALIVTQNGLNRTGRVQPGLQRVAPSGEVELIATTVAGFELGAPNDLVFHPDGSLYFTDPRGLADPTRNSEPGRLFRIDLGTGSGELVVEVGPVFPNGIAFLDDGTLVWTESFSRRVMALAPSSAAPEVVIELPERHNPDGLCVGADGTLFVASTYGHCVSVIRGSVIVDRLMCGDGMATNCCFGGTDLYVTESRRGTVWRFALGVEGLPLNRGASGLPAESSTGG